MTRALHLDPAAPGATILHASPADYLISRGGYAHIPRSAAVNPSGLAYAVAWCGSSFTVSAGGSARWTNDITDHPLCGTCLGRHTGWLHLPSPDGHPTTFNPTRSLTAIGNRRWCPSHLWTPNPTLTTARCLLCGFTGALRCAPSRGYREGLILIRHAPASPHALLHCPTCGWRHLYHRSPDLIACSRWGCTFTVTIPTD